MNYKVKKNIVYSYTIQQNIALDEKVNYMWNVPTLQSKQRKIAKGSPIIISLE